MSNLRQSVQTVSASQQRHPETVESLTRLDMERHGRLHEDREEEEFRWILERWQRKIPCPGLAMDGRQFWILRVVVEGQVVRLGTRFSIDEDRLGYGNRVDGGYSDWPFHIDLLLLHDRCW